MIVGIAGLLLNLPECGLYQFEIGTQSIYNVYNAATTGVYDMRYTPPKVCVECLRLIVAILKLIFLSK